jgi:hypothetical protein
LVRRARERPLLFVVGLVCAAAVVAEVAAVTGLFGLEGFGSRPPVTSVPDLNPHHQRILAITGNVTYLGSVRGYFPLLSAENLCGVTCPELPRLWVSNVGTSPPEAGVYFFYNVTNTANVSENLSVPVLTTSGPNPAMFYLETFCCYTTENQPYSELLTAPSQFAGGLEIGFEGYAFTTATIPAADSEGYTLYVNFTSN